MYSFLIIFTTLLLTENAAPRIHPNMLHVFAPQQIALKEDFRAFREAIPVELKRMKKRFNFPLAGPTNEIWKLVLTDAEKKDINLEKGPIPFTKKDFNQYHKRFYHPGFRKCLLHINTDILFDKGESKSPEFRITKYQRCRMIASYDKANQTLTLHLVLHWGKEGPDGKINEWVESNQVYSFEIINNRKIKFYSFTMPGKVG